MVAPSFFERIAPVYDLLTRLFMMGTYDSVGRRMLAEDTAMMDVLDLCCGTGYICNTIVARRIVGLDMSPRMLAINARVKRPNKTLVQASAYQMPFGQSEFDRIYCSSASHEFKLLTRLLSSCYRSLKPGGALVLFDIYQPANPFASAVINSLYRYVVERGIMFVHTREEWRRMLEEAGFSVKELEPVRGLFIYIRAVKPQSAVKQLS